MEIQEEVEIFYTELNVFEINIFEFFENPSINILCKKIYKILNVIKFNIFIRIFGNKFIFPIFKKIYIDRIQVSKRLEDEILKIKPDLIIYPTQSQSKADFDILHLCNQNNIRSFFLIDNWDNLSDKSIMFSKPDLLGVWGNQTKCMQ